jgi:hypothetical protein
MEPNKLHETTQSAERVRELGYGAAIDALDFEVQEFYVSLEPGFPVPVQALTLEGDLYNWCATEGEWDCM